MLHEPKWIKIHSFSDTSEEAYGVCLYLKCEDNLGNKTIHLLCANTKVAPLKTLAISKLNLLPLYY